MRLTSISAVAAASLLPGVALADHMNGNYYGLGPAAAYQLALQQSGRMIHGQIFECDEPLIALTGQTDGRDFGFGSASELRTGVLGTFQLRWSREGVLFAAVLGERQASAQFGRHQQPSDCGFDGEGESVEPPGPEGGGGDRAERHGSGEAGDATGGDGAPDGGPEGGQQPPDEDREGHEAGGPLPDF